MECDTIYRETSRIRHHECGPDGKLRLASLFDLLQEAAARHADGLGAGLEYLHRAGLLWVLSRIRLEIRRRPAIGENIQVETYPTGGDKLFALRQFTLTDADGAEIVRATSAWLLLDAARLRPRKAADTLPRPLPENPDRTRHFPCPDKIESRPVAMERIVRTVHPSEIDVNRHLNNAFFAAFAFDVLGKLTDSFCEIKSFQLNFQHAGALGDRIACGGVLEPDGRTFYLDGVSPDGRVCFFQAAGTLGTTPDQER